MSINNIKKLSMNSHFYSLLMQGFLSGYKKPCEIKLPFMAIPILLYAESREHLVKANKKSRKLMKKALYILKKIFLRC